MFIFLFSFFLHDFNENIFFLILVIATLDLKKNGIISIVGITSIILANLIGTLIGTACAAIIQPGKLFICLLFVF